MVRTQIAGIAKRTELLADQHGAPVVVRGPNEARAPAGKRKRDTGAKVRIRWAMNAEIASSVGMTKLGFELMSRTEQLRRIKRWLEREGVPASEMPTMRQLNDFWRVSKAPATARGGQ
jgi:hypothetical protein